MQHSILEWSIRAVLLAAGTGLVVSALRIGAAAMVAMLLLPLWTKWGLSVSAPVLPAVRVVARPENPWGSVAPLVEAPAAEASRFGPSAGQRVRFTRPDSWLAATKHPLGPPVDPQAATTEVARRFLAAYGPATHQDLAR